MKKSFSLNFYSGLLIALVLLPLAGVAVYHGWQVRRQVLLAVQDQHDTVLVAEANRGMRNTLLWMGITLLSALLIVRWFVGRYLIRNIQQLVASTQAIASQDFSQAPQISSGPAELLVLDESVKTMQENLQRATSNSRSAIERLARLNRMYSMLDSLNKTLLTGELDRESLSVEVCRIATANSDIALACVVLNEKSEAAPRLIAAGVAADEFPHEWDDSLPPFVATTLQKGCSVVCNDLASDASPAPWREAALQRGHRSAVAFPLRTGDRAFGAYVLFAGQTGAFAGEELKLLGQLATNLAYAVQFREQEERRFFAERAREKSENWFRTITENSSDLIIVIDPQGIIRFVSHSTSQLLGHRSNDLLERSAWNCIHPEDLPALQQALAQNLPYRGMSGPYQYRVRHKNESWLWFEAVANNLLSDAAVHGIVINARDITPRKLAEETIRYRLQFEQKIATISSRFVGGVDFDSVIQTALADMGSFRRADRAYLFLLRNGDEVMDNTHEWCAPGVSLQKDNLQNVPTAATPWWMNKLRNREIIRIPNVALLPPEAAAERAILESQQIKSLIALPVYMGDKLGGFVGFDNVHSTGEWGDEDNSLLQVAAELIGRAIAQRRAEQALHESRELYRTIFQGSRAVQLLIEPDSGAIVDANPAAIDFYGYTHDQLTALRIGDINTLSEQEIRQRMTAARDGSARQFEFQHRLASGQLRHVQVFSGKIVIAGKTLLNSIILDITDRQIAEAALRFTQFAVDHLGEMALWMNSSGRFTYVNDAACRLLGYSREELLTMSVPDIDPLYPKERWRENWAALCQHKHQVIESRHQAKDGHTFPVEITDNLIEIDGQMFNCAIVRDITERKRAEEELQQRYAQLERWQRTTVGREVRMIELKQEINSLCRAAGLPERYATKTPAELTSPDSGPAATSNEQGEVS
jgi:PAS domain S-box-containing protein